MEYTDPRGLADLRLFWIPKNLKIRENKVEVNPEN